MSIFIIFYYFFKFFGIYCSNKKGAIFMLHSVLDWIVQCFTSPPTQYRLHGRRLLQVKRPNQLYQSTEGKSTKENNPENKENTKYTCIRVVLNYMVKIKLRAMLSLTLPNNTFL